MKEQVANLVNKEIESLNVFVDDAFVSTEEGKKLFNIVLDSEEVIDLNKITEASRIINTIMDKHEEVLRVNHFNSTPVGYRYQISFTIFVDGNLSTFASHDIANKLEREIEADIPEVYLTVIHVNPLKIKNSKS